MRCLIPLVAAAWIAAIPAPARAAGTSGHDEPVSRPLAMAPGATSRSKAAEPVPAPTHFVLTGQLGRDGRVSIQCESAENPAWRAWRNRIDASHPVEAR
jgi:hypothetical protein